MKTYLPGRERHQRLLHELTAGAEGRFAGANHWSTLGVSDWRGDYYWKAATGVGDESVCYGFTGCQMTWIYIMKHPNDVDGAKEVAAFYCIDHAKECRSDVQWNGIVA